MTAKDVMTKAWHSNGSAAAMRPTIRPVGTSGIDEAVFTYPFNTKRKCQDRQYDNKLKPHRYCGRRAHYRGYLYCWGSSGKTFEERHKGCGWKGKFVGKRGEHVKYIDLCDIHFAELFLGLEPIPCAWCLRKIRKVNARRRKHKIDEIVGHTFVGVSATLATRNGSYIKKTDRKKIPTTWALPRYNIYCFHCGRTIISNSTRGYRRAP